MTRTPRKIPEVLTTDEQAILLKQPNKRYISGLRNLAIMRLMLDAGLRSAEVVNLKTEHINWTTGSLKVVQGKGSKDRIIWLNEKALDLLKVWRERKQIGNGHLFCTSKGTPLDTRYLRVMVARYAKRAGIEKHVHPHTLRHSCASDLYRQTKNIRLVQKFLGHSDLSTTMIYTHIVDDEMEEALKTFRSESS